ncbi:unnamed protein product [Urochloa humidicola]
MRTRGRLPDNNSFHDDAAVAARRPLIVGPPRRPPTLRPELRGHAGSGSSVPSHACLVEHMDTTVAWAEHVRRNAPMQEQDA